MAMSSQRRSVNRPLPSSPHCVPTITVPGTTAPPKPPQLSRVVSVLVRAPQLLVQRDRDDLPPGRAHLLAGEALDHRDGDRAGVDQAGVEEISRQDAAEPVPELLQVDDDRLLRIVEEVGDRAVDLGQQDGQVAPGHAERDLRVGEAHLVVGVEVVGGVEERHDHREAVLPQPDDLLHPPHLAVVAGVAPGTLAGRHPVLDDPAEHAGLDAPGPLALERLHRVHGVHAVTTAGRQETGGAGSGGGAAPPPPSSRAAPPGGPAATPRKPFRDGPTSSGTPAAAATAPSRASRVRLWAAVLPNPRPGSAMRFSSAMPASLAAARRSARKAPTSATTSP